MLLSKEKSCQTRSSSIRSISRKKSLIKIPSTSQIPKDFFRQPTSASSSYAPKLVQKSSLEFTFMPHKNLSSIGVSEQMKKSLDLPRKPTTALKRMGRLTLDKKNENNEDYIS